MDLHIRIFFFIFNRDFSLLCFATHSSLNTREHFPIRNGRRNRWTGPNIRIVNNNQKNFRITNLLILSLVERGVCARFFFFFQNKGNNTYWNYCWSWFSYPSPTKYSLPITLWRTCMYLTISIFFFRFFVFFLFLFCVDKFWWFSYEKSLMCLLHISSIL